MVFAFLRKNQFWGNPYPGLRCGEYNGYVGITPDEPELLPSYMTSGVDLDQEDYLDHHVSVYGGITFDCICSGNFIPKDQLCEVPLTKIPDDLIGCRILGWDTSHIDSDPDMDKDWCTRENLAFMRKVVNYIEEVKKSEIMNLDLPFSND